MIPTLLARARQAPSDTMPYQGDILPYLRGEDSALVPAGWYSVGDLEDSGVTNIVNEERSSWIFVEAADGPGTVVVDMGPNLAGLQFGTGTETAVRQKLAIAGVTFLGPTIVVSTREISWWYCQMKISPATWYERCLASAAANGVTIPTKGLWTPDGDIEDGEIIGRGGLFDYADDSAEWAAVIDGLGSGWYGSGFRINSSGPGGANFDLRRFGCDIGPCADDGSYEGGVWYSVAEGCEISNISELAFVGSEGVATAHAFSVDPGPEVAGGAEGDLFHNDAIQIGRSGWRPTFNDNWIVGRFMFNKEPTASKMQAGTGEGWQMRCRRNWHGPAIAPNTGGEDQVASLVDEDAEFADWLDGDAGGPWGSDQVAVFALNNGQVQADMTAEFGDGSLYISPTGESMFAYDGGTSQGGMAPYLTLDITGPDDLGKGNAELFVDLASIRADEANPINVWRAANPWDDLTSYAGVTAASGYRPS